jgi:hypothetical protein
VRALCTFGFKDARTRKSHVTRARALFPAWLQTISFFPFFGFGFELKNKNRKERKTFVRRRYTLIRSSIQGHFVSSSIFSEKNVKSLFPDKLHRQLALTHNI